MLQVNKAQMRQSQKVHHNKGNCHEINRSQNILPQQHIEETASHEDSPQEEKHQQEILKL